MIECTTGDIFKSDAEALVNTVNCVGVPGMGISRQFKKAYPENFAAYQAACAHRTVQPGKMFVFPTGRMDNPKYIVNFPTKRHWRGKSRMEDINTGLFSLAAEVRTRGIRSIAIPPLGCKVGGLGWEDVRARILATFRPLDQVRTTIFELNNPSAPERSSAIPRMNPDRAALVTLLNNYLCGALDPFVTLHEVQKLMYFLQVAGHPLSLRYKKHFYGPYAENLGDVLEDIESYFVSGYHGDADTFNEPLDIVPGAATDALDYLQTHPETRSCCEKVSMLIRGFETPYGLELLAAIHWLCAQEGLTSPEKAIVGLRSWNNHLKQYSPRQVGIGFDVLFQNGWLPIRG